MLELESGRMGSRPAEVIALVAFLAVIALVAHKTFCRIVQMHFVSVLPFPDREYMVGRDFSLWSFVAGYAAFNGLFFFVTGNTEDHTRPALLSDRVLVWDAAVAG